VVVAPGAPSMLRTPASHVIQTGWLRAEGVGATGRPMSEPSPTVTKVGNLYWYPVDPGRRCAGDRVTDGRRLSVRECAGLQGFPAGHPFQGTKTARYRQVGNAVPPRLAEVVGRAVVNGGGRPDALR
jgi:site-specific DNA-cytosine methylase